MPGGDGSGPLGRGSMTGRGLGNCNPNIQRNRTYYGRGFRRRFAMPYTETKTSLEEEKKALEARIKTINDELNQA